MPELLLNNSNVLTQIIPLATQWPLLDVLMIFSVQLVQSQTHHFTLLNQAFL